MADDSSVRANGGSREPKWLNRHKISWDPSRMFDSFRLGKEQVARLMLVGLLLTVLFLGWHRRLVIIRNRTTQALQLTVSLDGADPNSVQIGAGSRRSVALFSVPARGKEASIVVAGRDALGQAFLLNCGYETLVSSKNHVIILKESSTGEVQIDECESFDFLDQWLSR